MSGQVIRLTRRPSLRKKTARLNFNVGRPFSMKNIFLFIVLILISSHIRAELVTHRIQGEADSGYTKELGITPDRDHRHFQVHINRYIGESKKYSPATFFALYDQSATFRISLIDKKNKWGVIAEAEYTHKGKTKSKKWLTHSIQPNGTLEFYVSWEPDGTIKYRLNDDEAITVKTMLREFNQMIFASGVEAVYVFNE